MSHLYKNNMPYPIDVPTVSGGGRVIPPGGYVAGDFFEDLWKQTKLVIREKEGFKVKRDQILIANNKDGKPFDFTPYTNDGTPVPALVLVEKKDEVKPEEPKAKRGRPPAKKEDLETSLKEALNEMGNMVPGPDELERMPADGLRKVAARLGVSTEGTREDVLATIKRRTGM